MPTTTRKQTPAQARTSAPQSDLAPFYAVAGLTDAVADSLRTGLAETRSLAATRVADLQGRSSTLEAQAKTTAEEINKAIRSLPAQVKALPETTKARLAEAQKRAEALIAEANTAYGEYAGRGKRVVDETWIAARLLSGKAEKRAEDVLSEVADRVDPAFEKVQEGVTQARKTVTGRTATETVTPRGAAKAAASRAAAAGADEARAEARRAAARRAAATRAAKKAAAAG